MRSCQEINQKRKIKKWVLETLCYNINTIVYSEEIYSVPNELWELHENTSTSMFEKMAFRGINSGPGSEEMLFARGPSNNTGHWVCLAQHSSIHWVQLILCPSQQAVGGRGWPHCWHGVFSNLSLMLWDVFTTEETWLCSSIRAVKSQEFKELSKSEKEGKLYICPKYTNLVYVCVHIYGYIYMCVYMNTINAYFYRV